MHKVQGIIVWVLLGLVPLSGQLQAEEGEKSPSYYIPVGYFGARVGHIELEEVDDEGSYNFGIMGGVFLASRFAVEASIDFQESNFDLEFDDGTVITFPELERETFALQAGISFMPFPENQVRPYLLGGVGYYYSDYSSPDYPSDRISASGYFAGLGLELFGGSWDGEGSLVIEARWLFTDKEEYAEQRVRPDGFTVSIGFRVKFD